MIGPIDLKKLSWLYEQNHIEKTNNNCYAYQKKTFIKWIFMQWKGCIINKNKNKND
jgi:hypothetical protein